MRIACVIMAVLFGVATYVQGDDPDSGAWMVVYAIAGGISASRGLWGLVPVLGGRTRKLTVLRLAAGVLAGIALVWAATVVPEAWSHGSLDVNDEEQREIGGLVLVGAWMAAVALAGGPKGAQR